MNLEDISIEAAAGDAPVEELLDSLTRARSVTDSNSYCFAIGSPKITCPQCQQEVSEWNTLRLSSAGPEPYTFVSCLPCVIKILTDYPKNLRRIANLEQQVAEISSKIRIH
jgi:hypothetical protein